MLQADFGASSPGTLVDISEGGLAFIPNPIPPEVKFTRELLVAAEAARGAVGELVGHARLIANVDLVVQALARREAVLSSKLEGTHTTVVEVLMHEAAGGPSLEDSDLHEVLNYLRTIELATSWLAEGRRVGPPFVADLHARLLQGVRGADRNPGGLRRKNVFIGDRVRGLAGARFVPPPVEHVEPLIEDLFNFTRNGTTFGPMIDCAIAHYQFETIHPFEDGNGRLGRLLIPLHLMDWGVLDRPLLYLGPYLEEHADEYRDGLLRVSQSGDWSSWLVFFLGAIHHAALDGLARASRIVELQRDYRMRVSAELNSRYVLPALEAVFESVVVSVSQIEEATHATAPTAKKLIDAFTDLGILRLAHRQSGKQFWIASELLDEAYSDAP